MRIRACGCRLGGAKLADARSPISLRGSRPARRGPKGEPRATRSGRSSRCASLPPPEVRNTAWARGPIDRFILAAIEREGLQPRRPADRRTLIRRATFDLHRIAADAGGRSRRFSPTVAGAFAKVVDRLLASPQYGERWGRHWLDVARYADGDAPDNRPVYIGYGMAKDGFVNTFRYRDWVVDAFNSDMPYDRFVKAQIAADLLPERDRKKLLPGSGSSGSGHGSRAMTWCLPRRGPRSATIRSTR